VPENLGQTLYWCARIEVFHADAHDQEITEQGYACGSHEGQEDAVEIKLVLRLMRTPPMPGYMCHDRSPLIANRPDWLRMPGRLCATPLSVIATFDPNGPATIR
jgi:hypothetical protein